MLSIATNPVNTQPPASDVRGRNIATGGSRWLVAALPLVGAGLGFFTTALLAKALSLDDFGLYVTCIFTASVSSMVGAFGLGVLNASLTATNPQVVPRVNGDSILVTGVAGSVLAIFLWFALSAQSGVVKPHLLFLTVSTVPLSATTAALGGSLLGRCANAKYAAVSVAQTFIQFIGAALLVFVAPAAADHLTVAFSVYFTATAVGFALAATNGDDIASPSLTRIRAILPKAAPLWLHSMLTVASHRADVIVLSCFLPGAEVGRYAFALQLSYCLTYIAQGLSLAMFVDFARRDRKSAATMAGSLIRITALANIILGVIAYFAVAKLLVFFIPNAASTLDLLPLLIASSAIMSSQFIVLSCCQAMMENKSVLMISATNLTLRMTGVIAALRIGGLASVPRGLLVASLLGAAFGAAILGSKTGIGALALIMPRRDDVKAVGNAARVLKIGKR
ncbi:MAG: oligosaccharide flippase family protein [Bryobacteraceae bacterium]|nr:oligosaccharide flippase family protein [Bryobacteraceae bacterium]